MADYPSGTVAFLFTDIEGSTRLWETWRDAMEAAVDRHFAILEASVSAQHGVLFKKVGDACQAAFATVPAAVAAAIAAQLALRQEDWGELGPLRVRMAIHVGDATPVNGDYLAPALNRLARALASGHGEQILLTSAARSLAVELPAGYALQSLGQYRLRDLLEAEAIYQVVGPGLAAEFPPLNSLDRHQTNLPLQPTPFIGREDELETLAALLTAPQTRLVTLVGPGGSGKTRLALQLAAEVLDDFPDGVWWIPLAAISDPGLFIQAVAGPLGVRENPGQALRDRLAEYLRTRKSLLILDNLEQLIDAAGDIRALLDAAPGLVVLATSREPLRLRGEREFPVAPLPLPEPHARTTAEDALTYPAIRLFVDRARAVKPSFQLDATTVADVIAICRRLDGLPLAIELAAARIRILSPAALLARLDRRLTVLTGGARDLPARQQTLRATIAWSYDLLDPQEQDLFARLGVFVGGWTFDAGEAVCSAAGGLPLDLIDGLDSLVQKSLVRQDDVPGGDVRFTMLETVREFAQERFQELPAAEELRAVHAAWFLALAENANWDDFAAQAEVLIRLEAEHANFRQAIAYFEGQGAGGVSSRARLAAALSYFWWLRGYLTEGRSVLERVIAERDAMPTADCAAALSGVAFLVEAQGDMEQAEAFQEEALALYRTSGDSEGIGRALAALGAIARQRGDLAMARARLQEGLEAWRATGDVAGTAGALMELGLVRQLEGAYAEAVPQLQEALRLFRQVHDHMGEAHALNRLGLLAMSTGQLPDAIGHFAESLRLWRAMGNQQMLAADLHNLGEAHHLSGSLDEAEARYREALTLFEEIGDLRGRGFAYCHLGLLALDRGDLAEADRLLRQSLRLRRDAGFRASMTDTLEALAEVTWKLGDTRLAATMLRASAQLRAETGLARQPVYKERYRHVSEAVASVTLAEPLDLEQFIGSLTQSAPYAALLTA